MKQETLEEVTKKVFPHHKGRTVTASNKTMLRRHAFIKGAKWQQERSYSEEEVLDILDHHTSYLETFIYQYIDRQDIEVNEEWFEQFKKK